MVKEARVIVAGGRYFKDYQLLKTKLDHYLSVLVSQGYSITIVSGKANGADSLGERYAKERGYNIAEFPALWNDFSEPCKIKTKADGYKYNALAGMNRNKQMAQFANEFKRGILIAFWDKKSSGTKNMIDLGKQYELKTRVVNY